MISAKLFNCLPYHTGSDFSNDNLDVVFSPDNTETRQCFDIVIENDSILEDTEVFHLSILPTNDSAVLPRNTVLNVGIENDDSKQLTSYIYYISS